MAAPTLLDKALAQAGIPLQRTDEPPGDDDALLAPRDHETRVEGDFSDQARRRSVYTWLETHPAAGRAGALALAGGLGFRLLHRRRHS
jgi:hypothetical protein